MSFTIYTVVDALRRAPGVTQAMIDLFVARHDPGFKGNQKAAIVAATSNGICARFGQGVGDQQ